MSQFIEVNTDQIQWTPSVGNDLFTNRSTVSKMHQQFAPAEVSIIVVGFNRLEKSRRCVESILKYTQGIDYELILIDSGSEDGTLAYFKSVPYEKKRVIHITRNLGEAYAYTTVSLGQLGKFVCMVQNDLILTANWMENLLTCMKSDANIGLVVAMSSNSSNLQSLDFSYQSYEEMQELAARFNHSDPRKWEDRMRIITLGALFRKEALLARGWPAGDVGFFHDFFDDDIAFAIRRLGYRTIVAGDTWICHDHNIRGGEGKDPVEFQRSLDIGRKNFQLKYAGVDAWDDVNNYYVPYFEEGVNVPEIDRQARILGIDVKCGTPILDAQNWLRKKGFFSAELSAFTQNAKYWQDLKTICKGNVFCDREEFLADAFPKEYFDIVITDRPINQYHEPQKTINDIFTLCKKGGLAVFKLRNTFSFQEYIHILGQWDVYDPEFSYHFPIEALQSVLAKQGDIEKTVILPFPITDEFRNTLNAILPVGLSQEQKDMLLARMISREYLLFVRKV